jgi:hypothetical protein
VGGRFRLPRPLAGGFRAGSVFRRRLLRVIDYQDVNPVFARFGFEPQLLCEFYEQSTPFVHAVLNIRDHWPRFELEIVKAFQAGGIAMGRPTAFEASAKSSYIDMR